MTLSIVQGGTTITPTARLGFESANEARNVFHDTLTEDLGVTLFPDAPRSGTMPLLFWSAADAEAAREAFATLPGIWVLTDTDVPEVSMSFVRRGTLGAVQQDARLRWVLTVGYQEI